MADDYYGGWKDPKVEKWHRTDNDASFPLPEFKYIGARGLGAEAAPDKPEKVSGTGIFGRDVYLPGMLYAKALISPYANATIKSMDISKAEAYPGVRCVLRYDDPEWGEALTAQRGWGPNVTLARLAGFADREGQEVGVAVAADSEQIVDEALKLVEIVWEELPFLVEQDDPPEDRVVFDGVIEEFGDIDAGFAEADRTVEVKIKRNNTIWAGVEGLVATANWRADRYLDVWTITQTPHMDHAFLTAFWPGCRIHVHAPYHGAQFGGINWSYASYFPLLSCILAKRTGLPVKHLWDGSHFNGGSQADGTYYFKVGMKEDGTITAVDIHSVSPNPPGWARASGGLWLHENTKIHNARYGSTSVYVNQGDHPCWKHGGGYVFMTAMPHAIVAHELGMNPIDVMIKNNGTCEHDWEWLKNFMDEYGFDSSRNSLQEGIDACNKTIDMRNEWHAPGAKILPNGKYHGIGFGVSNVWTHVLGDKGGSHIGLALRPDGTLSIMVLRGDQGTGFQAAWVRAAADEMGMKVEDVDCQSIHDEEYFHAHDEGCSGGTISMVMSILKAARKLKQWVLEAATFKEDNWVIGNHGASWTNVISVFPDKTPEELDIKDSMVFEKANPENKQPLSAVVTTVDPGSFGGENRRPLFEWGWSRNIDPVLNPDEFMELHGWPCMVRQVQFIEIEVDPETGKVDVVKQVIAYDCGKAFYPEGVEQEDFSMTQGTSRVGLEELFYDPQTGVQLNNNLIGYPIALMSDFALPVANIIETGGGYGPYGSAGNGEGPGALGQSPILVAVHNAIGKWVDAPCTPEKVLKALGKI